MRYVCSNANLLRNGGSNTESNIIEVFKMPGSSNKVYLFMITNIYLSRFLG